MANTYLVPVVALYKAPHYTGSDFNNVITVNADRLQAFTPRPGYLKRYLVPGQNQVQVLLTFEPTSAELLDPNTLSGVYIEQDGEGVLIDCISVANFDNAINNNGSITQNYPSGVPLFTNPTATAYCLVRADDGSNFAHSQVTMQYINQYYGNVTMRSNFSGVSHYTMFSFQKPVPQGTDVITSGACSS